MRAELAGKEVFAEYSSPHGESVTHIRSTLITSSLDTLRQRGHFDRYMRLLPSSYQDQVLLAMGPAWLPVEVVYAHYLACEALRLSPFELEEIAQVVGDRVSQTFIGTFLRSSRSVGGSPWLALKQCDLLWSRVARGGSVRIVQRGPKDALIESRGIPMFDIPYFAIGYCRFVRSGLLVFAKSTYARQLQTAEPQTHLMLVSWV